MKKLFTCLLVVLTTVAYTQKKPAPETKVLLRDTIFEMGVADSYIAIQVIQKGQKQDFNYLFLQGKFDTLTKKVMYKVMPKAFLAKSVITKRRLIKAPGFQFTPEEWANDNIVNLISMWGSLGNKKDGEIDPEKKSLWMKIIVRIEQEIAGTRLLIKKSKSYELKT